MEARSTSIWHVLLVVLIAAGPVAGCGDEGGGGADGGTGDADSDVDTDTDTDADGDTDTGTGPSDLELEFVQLGQPPDGYPVITDITEHAGRLYVTTCQNPLSEWGAAVFSTEDGETFETVIDDPTSQGFLRLREFGGFLYIPDGDPNGYDPSFVYIIENGGSPVQTEVTGAVHTFDVILYQDDLLASNGMLDGHGSLCRTPDNGASPWAEVEATDYSRLKYLAELDGMLFSAKRTIGSNVDFLVWLGDVDTNNAVPMDVVPGEANTWRWYVTAAGDRLYWSMAANSELDVYYTEDGSTWAEVADLAGMVVSGFAELDGQLYALTHQGLARSDDGESFELVAAAPTSTTFSLVEVEGGYNADATAAITVYGDRLWFGSSNDGHLYVVE